jgi:hypothetical protein
VCRGPITLVLANATQPSTPAPKDPISFLTQEENRRNQPKKLRVPTNFCRDDHILDMLTQKCPAEP